MWYGWAGATLEIDLSRGKIEKVVTDRQLTEDFLGGKGTNAKILWDRVPPEVDAFSPDNLLIVSAGVLSGTLVPGANRTIITFKSPVMGIKYYCTMGGFFGPQLKQAGYDTIIFSGKSPVPVYLWIDDDHVELRNASHIWGKGNLETRQTIQEELKDENIEIMSIGLAGENRVAAASIEGSYSVSASRGGGGVVMGDKNLKAIAVRGTGDVNVFNGARLFELSEPILERSIIRNEANWKEMWLGAGLVTANPGAVGHFSGDVSPEVQQKVKGYSKMTKGYYQDTKTRDAACFNCSMPCKRVFAFEGYHVAGKCQWNTAGVINSQVMNPRYGLKYYALCQKHGLDDISLSQYIGFAIDLYRRGILTREDTDGVELEWGNPEIVYDLIEKIARRQGIGDVLADGLYLAAQRIGRGAENYTYLTKKLEPLPFDVRGLAHRALPIATIDKADRTRGLSGTYGMWERPREEREAYIKAGFFQYPEEFKQYFLSDFDPSGQDYEAMIQFMSYNEEILALTDATGFCFFWTNFGTFPPINNRPLMAELVSAATGMDIDEAGMTEIAQRIGHLVRAYNVREGIRRKDDDMADTFYEKSPEPPHRQIDRALFNKWLDRYYELKGWDNDGIPTGGALHEIGLEYVRQDLEQRRILTPPSGRVLVT
ncbi:MAG: aldehyde ferredoxin oxidoreductase C-terminal domain-containing protein [Dehalococcoidales bacterium]|nr:aldehyde ferredoxin oxidoreductase C-terminal domain-containing protein [Dehalococcoidales bacterium]